MRINWRHLAINVAGAMLLASALMFAQGTQADYERAARFLNGEYSRMLKPADIQPEWLEGTDKFWYRKPGRDTEFVLVDAEKNTSGPAFDHAKLAESLSKATHKTIKQGRLPFNRIEFVEDGKAIRFEADEQRWTCELADYKCSGEKLPPEENVSPDGKWAAYVDHYNLYVRNLSTGTVSQLTHDGEKYWDYATPLPYSNLMTEQGTEDVKQRAAVSWSPDSTKLATFRMDSRRAGRFTTLQFVPPNQLRPKAFTYVYPLPGEIMPTAEPLIFDLQTQKCMKVQTDPIELYFQGGLFFPWYKDSKRLHYRAESRGYKSIEFREVDAETGKQRVVISERGEKYVDPGETDETIVNEGTEILWTSERDGWNHIYLYDGKTGKLENQVTKGPWVVDRIVRADEKNRMIYFLAGGREAGEDPYLTHLYKIKFDGTGLQLLTPENANHVASVSEDGRFFVDSFSRADLPGQSDLGKTSDGSVVRVLEKAEVS